MATERELLAALVAQTAKQLERPVTVPMTPAEMETVTSEEERRRALLRYPPRPSGR
jgi:hypothetical protein